MPNKYDRSKVQRIKVHNEVVYVNPLQNRALLKKYYQPSPTLVSGVYGGYRFRAVMNMGLNPCAYIEVEDPLTIRRIQESERVHGGVTYVGDTVKGLGQAYVHKGMTWVGWDYSHAYDYNPLVPQLKGKQWTTKEILKEIKAVIDDIKE